MRVLCNLPCQPTEAERRPKGNWRRAEALLVIAALYPPVQLTLWLGTMLAVHSWLP